MLQPLILLLPLLAAPERKLRWRDVPAPPDEGATSRTVRVFETPSSQGIALQRLASILSGDELRVVALGSHVVVAGPLRLIEHLTRAAEVALEPQPEPEPKTSIAVFPVQRERLKLSLELVDLLLGSDPHRAVSDPELGILAVKGSAEELRRVEEALERVTRVLEKLGAGAAAKEAAAETEPEAPAELPPLQERTPALRPTIARELDAHGLEFSRFPTASRRTSRGGTVRLSQKVVLKAAPLGRIVAFVKSVAAARDGIHATAVSFKANRQKGEEQEDSWASTVEFIDTPVFRPGDPAPLSLDFAAVYADFVKRMEAAEIPYEIQNMSFKLEVRQLRRAVDPPEPGPSLHAQDSQAQLVTSDPRGHLALESSFRKGSRFFNAAAASKPLPSGDGFRVNLTLEVKPQPRGESK